MAKSKAVSGPPRMRPMLFLESDSGTKIPKALRGKLGKIVNLLVKSKVVSQRLSQHAGEKKRESYDLDVLKIKSTSKLGKIIGS